MRCVRHEGRIPHKEGFLLLPRLGDEIVDRLHALAPDGEARIAVAGALRHAVREATARVVALPPLAGLKAQVTFAREQAWQRRHLVEHAIPLRGQLRGGAAPAFGLRAWRQRWIIGGDLVLMWIETGDDGRQTRTTNARGHKSARKGEALRREPVEMRRLHLRMPHEAVITRTLIVRDDEDDVRPRVGGVKRTEWNEKQGDEEKERGFHGVMEWWRLRQSLGLLPEHFTGRRERNQVRPLSLLPW